MAGGIDTVGAAVGFLGLVISPGCGGVHHRGDTHNTGGVHDLATSKRQIVCGISQHNSTSAKCVWQCRTLCARQCSWHDAVAPSSSPLVGETQASNLQQARLSAVACDQPLGLRPPLAKPQHKAPGHPSCVLPSTTTIALQVRIRGVAVGSVLNVRPSLDKVDVLVEVS